MSPNKPKNRLPQNLSDIREDLKGMGNEIRLQMHLASLDLKDEWEKLQPKLQEAEQYWEVFTDATLHTAHDLQKRVKEVRRKLRDLSQGHATRSH
jgi:hypothetical protein